MKRVLISFTGSAYDSITERVVDTYRQFGATDLHLYDEPWLIESGFVERNRWLWEVKGLLNERGGRGFGLYSWKGFIISHALSQLEPGDFCCYVDGDTYPIAPIDVLFSLCEKEGGHLAFMATGTTKPLCNRQWVKRECFQCMGMDSENWWHTPHAVARFMVFQKQAADVWNRNELFLSEWQRHCLDRQCQTFDHDPKIQLPGPVGDGPEFGFREHRTEQAIYSLLCQKYGRRLYREACQFGKDCPQDWEHYPQLFVQVGSHGPASLRGSKFREQFKPGGSK